MNVDDELQAWQRQWREQAPAAPGAEDLARWVHSGTRTARLWTLIAVLVTLGMVVPLVWRLLLGRVHPQFAAGILVLVVLVWATTIWLARGTWRPRDESTSAFLEVSIRRCQAALLGAPVGSVLYLAELAYVVVSLHRLEGLGYDELLRSGPVIALGWIGAPLYIGSQFWYARRQRHRLARLRELQAQLAA